ncbi:MAG: hypothetical protein ACK4PK_03120 [Alphaproteobacteria bacterium]
MARKPKEDSPAFSIRFTKEERARLDAAAGDMPIGAYIRSRLFDTPSPRLHPRKHRPDVDRAALNKLLRELGHQHIASNLNRIMKAIEEGDLEIDEKLEMELRGFRADLRALMRGIKKAMGRELSEGQWGGKR